MKRTYCNFCGKSDEEVAVVVTNADCAICDVCIELARDICGAYRQARLPETQRSYGKASEPNEHESVSESGESGVEPRPQDRQEGA